MKKKVVTYKFNVKRRVLKANIRGYVNNSKEAKKYSLFSLSTKAPAVVFLDVAC